MSPIAFVRAVPASFQSALTSRRAIPPLDPLLARSQHEAYRAALESSGYGVVAVPFAEDCPDSPFIEDAAVVIGERALISRPGHPARRAETEGVAATLGSHFDLVLMGAPATLDGGDVLVAGGLVLVGVGRRTNRAGFETLRALAEPMGYVVRPAEVGAVLHLKSGVSAISDTAVLWHRSACDPGALEGLEVVEVPGDDPEAANVVRLADGGVLVGADHDETAEVVASRGLGVERVDVSEFARADGGLTCLSIRVRSQ